MGDEEQNQGGKKARRTKKEREEKKAAPPRVAEIPMRGTSAVFASPPAVRLTQGVTGGGYRRARISTRALQDSFGPVS